MPISDGPWMASAPHPQTHACMITNPQGRVIAAMVPNQDDADFIAQTRNQRDRLRAALAGLVGAESEEELRAMEAVMRMTTAPDADKAVMLNAIHALLEATNGAT